jgi:hypothetical protein
MLLENLGDVIATRELMVRSEPHRKISVMMGKPQLWEGGPDCLCPVLIVGAGDEKVRCAAGVDSFQAIELAFKMISLQLRALRRDLDIDLCRWQDDNDPYVGFPPPVL